MSRTKEVNSDDIREMFSRVFFWSRNNISYPLLPFPIGSNAYTVRRRRRLTLTVDVSISSISRRFLPMPY
jgi:hypothetical protein